MPVLLQINVSANWGSTGKIVEDIGRLAMAQGWESWIAYGRGKPESQSRLIRIGNDWDIRWHGCKTRFFDGHGLASQWATKKLIEKIEIIQPDIIHLHNIHGYYLNYPILFEYLQSLSIPVVWTLHDCWAFTGHCAYFDYVGCERWKHCCGNCPQIQTYPKSLFFDRSGRNYELKKKYFTSISPRLTLVPVSEWLGSHVSTSFLKCCRIKVIHNGIDLDVFKPIQSRDTNNKQIVLGVASVWESRKGLKDFCKLNDLLNDEYQIVLVGLNDKQIAQLPKNMRGIARTDNVSELVKLYSSATVFVNPTYEDNFPTTNLEALASGTPVITYRTGGSIEAVDRNTGIIVEQGDIKGLKDAIDMIAKSKDKFNDFQCRERAERFYNKNDRYQEYIDLYNELINNL